MCASTSVQLIGPINSVIIHNFLLSIKRIAELFIFETQNADCYFAAYIAVLVMY